MGMTDDERMSLLAWKLCEYEWEGVRYEMAKGCRCGGCMEYQIFDMDGNTIASGDDLREAIDKAAAVQTAG